MNIIVAILGISFLVIVHETGHYLAARAFGMRVLRYSIGLGPVLFKYQPQGSPTIFQICAIPFLAYVQIDGMNPTDDVDRDDPTLFPNKSVLARMVTIFAGPLANYLTASLICFGIFSIDGIPVPEEHGPMTVGEIDPSSPAATAGVREGDVIVEAEGQTIHTIRDLQAATQGRPGQPTSYVIERDGQRIPVVITPRDVGGRGIIGVTPRARYEAVSIAEAGKRALLAPVLVTIASAEGIVDAIRTRNTDAIGGPVAMGEAASQHAERGPRSFLEFIAFVSIALGFFNLLPFPALDGGRLIFLGFELITRRRANERVEAVIHTVGILFLLGLIVLVTFRDVGRVIGG